MEVNMSTFYEIIKHIGVIREYPTGWKKELNIVRWGENRDSNAFNYL